MKRLATQIALGVSIVFAGLAISGSAKAQTWGRWQNLNEVNGQFYLGVAGGEVCNGPNGSCGVKRGAAMITWQRSGEDQDMGAPVDDATGTIQDFYNDSANDVLPMCVGVAANSLALNAGVVIWDCQDQSQGPGQYWKTVSASELGAPFPGCFAFVNQNSSVNGKTVVMSVQGGVVKNGQAVVQYTLCTPTNGACGNPSNWWHEDQFWCPAAN
jgi:hypothetical protein